MASLSDVSTEYRFMDIEGIDDSIEFDEAKAIMKHDFYPSKNQCSVEFKIPALRKQFGVDAYSEIEKKHLYENPYNFKYDSVTNFEFHKFIKKRITSKIRVFEEDTREWVTMYFSEEEKLRAMLYDYQAALLLHIKFPVRYFMRRRSCTTVSALCTKCDEYLSNSVDDFVDYSEDYLRADFFEYWFRQIGDEHGLLVAITREREFEFRYSEGMNIPEYFTLDFSNTYFKDGINNKERWMSLVYENRFNDGEEYYSMKHRIGESAGLINVAYGPLELFVFNKEEILNYVNVGSNSNIVFDFISLSRFDMGNSGYRNTWHKKIFNNWVEILQHAKDGWYCTWDGIEDIKSISDAYLDAEAASANDDSISNEYPTSLEGIDDMGNQLVDSFAWNDGSESMDTIYIVVSNRIDGYEYENVSEAHPDRDLSPF